MRFYFVRGRSRVRALTHAADVQAAPAAEDEDWMLAEVSAEPLAGFAALIASATCDCKHGSRRSWRRVVPKHRDSASSPAGSVQRLASRIMLRHEVSRCSVISRRCAEILHSVQDDTGASTISSEWHPLLGIAGRMRPRVRAALKQSASGKVTGVGRPVRCGVRRVGASRRAQASSSQVPGVGGDTSTALGPGVMISTRAGPSPVFSA